MQAPHTTASASIIKLIMQWLILCDIINLSYKLINTNMQVSNLFCKWFENESQLIKDKKAPWHSG